MYIEKGDQREDGRMRAIMCIVMITGRVSGCERSGSCMVLFPLSLSLSLSLCLPSSLPLTSLNSD